MSVSLLYEAGCFAANMIDASVQVGQGKIISQGL
jgi:hypothetical protein